MSQDILQYNKRDLHDLVTVEELSSHLNEHNWQTLEAVASKGDGVLETLKLLTKNVLSELRA